LEREKSIPAHARVFILAGGLGSRSEDPSLPKILQSLGGDSRIIDLQLGAIEKAGFKKVTLLLGHNAELVIDYLRENGSFDNLDIETLVDPVPLGTSDSVIRALDANMQDELFLILLGDTALAAPLDLYFDRWRQGTRPLGVLCHPNLHMHDSDILHLDESGIIREFTEKGLKDTGGSGLLKMAATGVLFFDRRALKNGFGSETDITKALIKLALEDFSGEGIISSHYFKDSGTPSRVSSIRDDFRSGALARRGSRSRPALILDRDGTLFKNQGSSRMDVNGKEIPDEIAKSLALCNRAGIPIFLATNQPGIAKGQITHQDVFTVHNSVTERLGKFEAWIDGLYFCPHHPDSGFLGEVPEFKLVCRCRKPKDGLLQALSNQHGIKLEDSFYIGDSDADRGAASAAGSNFLLASYDGSVGLPTWGAINLALGEILSDCHTDTF
jgi:D-glycero-D-manno-heptose 1,7-bisphosphate phosphatase